MKTQLLRLLSLSVFALWALGGGGGACDKKVQEPGAHQRGGGHAAAAATGPAGADQDRPKPAAEGRRVAIDVGDSAYEPARVPAKKGERLTLVFTRTSKSACGEVVMFPEQGIKKRLPLMEPVEIGLTANETGEIAFTCGMRMMKGSIVVN